jgi:AraC-like DNA-binding protein
MISSYNSGLQIWIERHGNQVKYCQKYAETLEPDKITEICHLGLTNALATAGILRGFDWRPTRIELATSPIDLGGYYPELAETPVSFNHPQTSIWFDEVWLSKPLPSSPCSTATEDERASFLATAPAYEPVRQLEQVIESSLEHPNIGLHLTAAIIGTSPRSMQRHLSEQDLSFSRLLQSVRFRTAQKLLRDRRMPLSEVARRLGYSELANFTHAFKRWTGVGPNKFRQLLDGDRCSSSTSSQAGCGS